ncbi:DUF2856 family protein [Escherichia coli]|nr:DUF2856 family protein [Escherichia coli]
MPAPLYGADDPRRCSGNSISEVLDKFRKKYVLIMSLPQETKSEIHSTRLQSAFRHSTASSTNGIPSLLC